MTARVLVDTNVLVYSYDRSEMDKQAQAKAVLEALVDRGAGVLSTQVLGEFFVAVTRKIKAPLSISDAYQRLENYFQVWPVIDLTGLIVLEAARGVRDYQFNYWDAQLWATAKLNQIEVVFSEDFNPGAVIEGVRFINPFTSDFALLEWF